MNKLTFSLLIAFIISVIIILLGIFYILSQNQKILIIEKETLEISKKSNENKIAPLPVISLSNNSDESILLEDFDYGSKKAQSDSSSNNTTASSNLQLKSNRDQEKTTQEQNLSNPKVVFKQDQKQNNFNSNLTSTQNKKNSLKEKYSGSEKTELSDAPIFTFCFSNYSPDKSDHRIKVAIPIKTHTGYIEEYPYSAKLENGVLSVNWEIPNWFLLSSYGDKDISSTYNSIKYANLSILKNSPTIYLSRKIPLELTFEASDGLAIPDGSKIRSIEFDSWVDQFSPVVKNQKSILNLEPGQIVNIPSLYIGQYYSESFFIDTKIINNPERTIHLKKKILFKAILLDQNMRPIVDHYVLFSKEKYYWGYYRISEYYEKNGHLEESKLSYFATTDSNGEINGEIESIGESYATIFGPKIKKGIRKNFTINSDNEIIQIQINVSTSEIKITFLENGIPYIGELNGSYANETNSGVFNTKTGTFILNQIQPGNLTLHLKSNLFINSTTKLIVPESGILEKEIELKPGAFLSGTIMSNGAPILGKELGLYVYEKGNFWYGQELRCDKMGHFRFTGLNPEKIYIMHVSLTDYKLDTSFSEEYRTTDKEVIVNLIGNTYFSAQCFDEKGLPVNIKKVSTSIIHKNKENGFDYSQIKNNTFSIPLISGDTLSFGIQFKDYATHYQTIVYETSLHTTPLKINLQKGFLVNGIAYDLSNKPLFSGLIVDVTTYENHHLLSNKVDAYSDEISAIGIGGTFQLENAQIGEKFYILSKGNSPILFVIEEKHRNELIELKTTKSYSFSGNLRSQKNILQEGRRVFGERDHSKEYAASIVDAKGNFYIDCLRPGKWIFTSNFRDLYKNYPTIEIEISDKNEAYDWVVFR
jgi:hypothetical protein